MTRDWPDCPECNSAPAFVRCDVCGATPLGPFHDQVFKDCQRITEMRAEMIAEREQLTETHGDPFLKSRRAA